MYCHAVTLLHCIPTSVILSHVMAPFLKNSVSYAYKMFYELSLDLLGEHSVGGEATLRSLDERAQPACLRIRRQVFEELPGANVMNLSFSSSLVA